MKNEKEHNRKIICVDSDGCVMDTMNVKHERFFGPLAAEVFEIEEVDEFMSIWNQVNLYSVKRGVNRFVGLVISLELFGYKQDISRLKKWVETTPKLSNGSLKKEIESAPCEDLQRALKWSEQINHVIMELTWQGAPFPRVKNALHTLSQSVDLAVVSSCHHDTIEYEWKKHGLLQYVRYVFGQEEGRKVECLQQLIHMGYQKENILMVGDSLVDLQAAKDNDIAFYPILFGQENKSWNELSNYVLDSFLNDQYQKEFQTEAIYQFIRLLDRSTY